MRGNTRVLGGGGLWAACIIIWLVFCSVGYAQFEDRGDLNLNGTPFELEDAAIFADYFDLGLFAFVTDPGLQIAATDINMDGITLTVADYVMMIRIVMGEPDPPGQPTDTATGTVRVTPYATRMDLKFYVTDFPGAVFLQYDTPNDVSAAAELLPDASGMTLDWVYTGRNLLVKISDMAGTLPPATYMDVLRITYNGDYPEAESEYGVGTGGEMIDLIQYYAGLPGDINANGVGFEIADKVLFLNAMVSRESVLTVDPELQLLACDVNGDGIPLGIDDFQYFLNVFDGVMELGDPEGEPYSVDLIYSPCPEEITFSVVPGEIPEALMITYYDPEPESYNIGRPGNVKLLYGAWNDTLRLILYDLHEISPVVSPLDILSLFPPGSQMELISAEGAGVDVGEVTMRTWLRGDSNTDGVVNVGDIVFTIRYVFGSYIITPIQEYLMNVNGDASLSVGDAVYMVNFVFKQGSGPGCQ